VVVKQIWGVFFYLHYLVVLVVALVREEALLPAWQGGLYPPQVSGAHQGSLTVRGQHWFVVAVAAAVY
jgi:hypothetical protein